jgi:hypothetical protein
MIFTEAEMDDLWHDYKPMSCREYTRHVEAKILARLTQGVEMPEPVAWLAEYEGDVFTADQLRIERAAARLKALEDAAVVCENESCSCCWTEDATEMASHLQDAIRELKGTTP